MNLSRPTAITTAVFFLLTEIGAIAGRAFYGPILTDASYITSAGADDRVLWGALCELLLMIAAVGTAVTLYPIVKRQNEGVALGFLMARVLEAVAIMVGILSLLTIVALRKEYAGNADLDVLTPLGSSLLAIHDWTFLFGPNFALGAASVLLAHLMYTSRLVPRTIAILGLVGGTLIFASAIAVIFGAYEQTSTPGLLVAIPVFAWELALVGYLLTKGFRPVTILTTHTEDAVR